MKKTITLTYGGAELEVTGNYLPYVPAVPYLENGDPGYDAEGGYFEDYAITAGGVDVTGLLAGYVRDEIEALAAEIAEEERQ